MADILVAEEELIVEKPIEEAKPLPVEDGNASDLVRDIEREDIYHVYQPVEMTTVSGEKVMIKQKVESHSIERLQQRQAELTDELNKVNTLLSAIAKAAI